MEPLPTLDNILPPPRRLQHSGRLPKVLGAWLTAGLFVLACAGAGMAQEEAGPPTPSGDRFEWSRTKRLGTAPQLGETSTPGAAETATSSAEAGVVSAPPVEPPPPPPDAPPPPPSPLKKAKKPSAEAGVVSTPKVQSPPPPPATPVPPPQPPKEAEVKKNPGRASLGFVARGEAPALPPVTPLPAPRPLEHAAPSCPASPETQAQPPGQPAAQPNPEVLKEFSQFVQGTVDATNTLDLVVGRPRLLVLKEPPKRVQTDSEERNAILSFNLVTDREISLVGRRVGTAVLNLWFPDPKDPTKERILSYLVRVLPDFQAAEQARQWQERYYKALEKEINCAFPDSAICLRLAGNNLIVSGEAHDIEEAAHIIQVVTTNAPRSFLPTAPIAPGQVTQTSATTDVSLTGSQTTQTTVTTPTTEPGAETGLAEARTQVGQAGQQGRTGTQGYNIVNLIHVPGEQQVSLKVTVAEVNRQAARTIGINFNILNNKGQVVFANNTGEIGGGGVPGGMNNGNSGMGANLPVSLDNGKINLAIQALRNLNFARTLAEPNLVTMNGKTARFQAGGQFPVPIVTGFTAAGLQGVSFVPFGVQLNFTPTITDKDRIRLSVGAEVSTRDAANSATIGNTSVPSLNNRTFQTTVELREGQTLAVAGLIQNNFGANATRVPLFGDLPVIGRLFAFDGTSAAEQELVILVTPELVHPVEHEKPALPGSDLFEPGDVEFYLLGRLESRRSYDYRSPVRTDINRMARYQHCEDIFITGPKGHSDGH